KFCSMCGPKFCSMNITQMADAEGGHDQADRKHKFVELLAKVQNAQFFNECLRLLPTIPFVKSLTAGRSRREARGWSRITCPSRCRCWRKCGLRQRTTSWT